MTSVVRKPRRELGASTAASCGPSVERKTPDTDHDGESDAIRNGSGQCVQWS